MARQHEGIEVLTAQLKEHAAQIQNVSMQIELKEVGPKAVVANKP